MTPFEKTDAIDDSRDPLSRGNEMPATSAGTDRARMLQPRRLEPARLLLAAAVLIAAFGWVWVRRSRDVALPDVLHLDGHTMGTTYSIRAVLSPGTDEDSIEALSEAIEERLAGINARMSVWDPHSEISRFNTHASPEPFDVSGELASLVERSLDIARRSGGAFDPTVGPLVDLWGFGPAGREGGGPDAEAVEQARGRVGYDRLSVAGNSLRKERIDLRLDLGAIAKGYGVDAVAGVIADFGFENYLVEIGGDVYAAGENAAGTPWRIGVDRPDPGARPGDRVHVVLGVSGAGVATSGGYRNYRFDEAGRPYTHIVDPRDGRPVRGQVTSVTVVAPDATLADALATALFVMGHGEGLAWLSEAYPEADALFLVRDGRDLREFSTPGFSRWLPRTGRAPGNARLQPGMAVPVRAEP